MKLIPFYLLCLAGAAGIDANYLDKMQHLLDHQGEQHGYIKPQNDDSRFELVVAYQPQPAQSHSITDILATPVLSKQCDDNQCQYSFASDLSDNDIAMLSEPQWRQAYQVAYTAGYQVGSKPLRSVMVFEVE